MKATINELWDTGRMIISFDDSDVCRPSSIAELKKCENVLVGNRIDGPKSPYEVLIDNSIQMVMPTTVNHPYGGKMYILEVYQHARSAKMRSKSYVARWKNGEPLMIDGLPAESDSLMELRQVVNRYLKLTQRNWEEVELFRIGKKSTYKFNR